MLTALTRKLCPFVSLAIATVGCGKKITDPESQGARQTENQELPSAYVLRLDGSETSRKNFPMVRSANFRIPDKLKVREGNTSGRIVEIAYDVNPYDSEDYEFKCSYIASANPSEMVLTSCVNYDNDDYGDVSNEEFRLYKDDLMQMRFADSAPRNGFIVEAVFSMKWF